MNTAGFAEFQALARAQGYDEVLERIWNPLQVVPTHSHPFAVSAQMVAGEMWLTCGEHTRHLLPGDRFELERDAPHSERYGPSGATFWAARRHAVK